jgi:hypothetical protein
MAPAPTGSFQQLFLELGRCRVDRVKRRRLHSHDNTYQGIGGEECLSDRLLRDCDQNRTPREERMAQNLAPKRDHKDDDDDMSRIPPDRGGF